MESSKEYWFPAKKYGWGWSFPSTWQGWLVLAAYLAGIVSLAVFVRPDQRPVGFFVSFALLTLALLVISWFKGEPPRWRWGGR